MAPYHTPTQFETTVRKMDPSYQLRLETMLLLARKPQFSSAMICLPQLERRISRPSQQTLLAFGSQRTLPPQQSQTIMSERQRFYMFTKVLFKYLKRANVDARYAKLVVAKCIRHNQNGESASLVGTLELELRQCIGEIHWLRANMCFEAFCRKAGLPITQVPTNMLAV